MEPHWHCDLCEHQDVSLRKGNICGLTGNKPNFKNTCNTIEFGEKRKQKVIDTNAKLQKILKNKWWVYSYFILFNIFAIVLFYLDYLFLNYLKHFFLMAYAVPIIISAIAIVLLGMGWGALNNYRNNLNIAKANKSEVDAALSAYDINYDLKLDFLKSFHGVPKVKSYLKFYYIK
ncbi:hypothetical protein [Zunongwangia endophytica]|uniref:Uncharacterized protein n=1 Tax=Zunongwangia endophytica TaxID=1808945 RepID=A0ABV8HEA8_9FLAO|nr:hypothetical protein [Zunongwangia endophytica]MDN3594034.1 hypothetical protein [Zunongwangia endophytica]